MSRHEWFKESLTYWSEQDASVDGMLGGYGRLHLPDIRDSRAFLLHCYSPLFERFHQNNRISPRNKHVDDKITMTKGKQKLSLALDVGAGIGRISEHLLLPHFERVSLLESDPRFCEVAKGRLNMDNINNSQLSSEDKIYRIHCCRLQEFTPSEEEMQTHRYDLIWIQWVLSYASDEELVQFLHKCGQILNIQHGMIVIKENILRDGSSNTDAINKNQLFEPQIDPTDHSIVRSDLHFRKLFEDNAGYEIVDSVLQKGFPSELFPVRMYMLRRRQPDV